MLKSAALSMQTALLVPRQYSVPAYVPGTRCRVASAEVFLEEMEILVGSAGWGACNCPSRVKSQESRPFFSSPS